MLRSNNKGQVGETMSWVVATLIIIGILIAFIYISVLMADLKKISLADIHTESEQGVDILSEKTVLAHTLANNKDKQQIDQILGEKNA